jgi:hypothetical protein
MKMKVHMKNFWERKHGSCEGGICGNIYNTIDAIYVYFHTDIFYKHVAVIQKTVTSEVKIHAPIIPEKCALAINVLNFM